MKFSGEYVLGIDLGTTNSCVSVVNKEGQVQVIKSDKGYTTIPSVIGINAKGRLVVGHSAVDQIITNPVNTIYGSKRFVGRKYHSAVVQQMKQFFNYPIVEGENGECAVMLGNQKFNLAQVSALILKEIRSFAEGILETLIPKAVITVPAYYNDNQRQAVKRAGQMAGLEVIRIINEPTAAAISYGFNRELKQKVLVYDFGGGTFDVSLLEISHNDFNVLATDGDTFLGGIDIDNCLTAYILEQFRKSTGKDLLPEKVAVQRIRNAAERVKRDLSTQTKREMMLPYICEIEGAPVDLNMIISRAKLNEIAAPLVQRTLAICDSVIESLKMSREEIDEVLLVGGQTRMPFIREAITRHFGKEPRQGVHPDEVVSQGAAILGNLGIHQQTVKLNDVLSIPIGVALSNQKFKPIIPKNTPIPASTSFHIVKHKNRNLVIDLFQGEHESILQNEYLGTFQLIHTEPQDQKIELRFELSPECLLTIKARDIKTGKTTETQLMTRKGTHQNLEGLHPEALNQDPSPKFTDMLKRFFNKTG